MMQSDKPLQRRPQGPDPRILAAVYSAIDDLNQLLPLEHQLEKSLDAPILGPTAVLDSMGFINLIAALEERITAELGVTLSLVSRDNRRNSYRTVGTLVEYISQLLAAKNCQA